MQRRRGTDKSVATEGVDLCTPRRIILRAAASSTKSILHSSASLGHDAPRDQREEVGETASGHTSGSRPLGDRLVESSHGPAANASNSTSEWLDTLSRHDAVWNCAEPCLTDEDADHREDDAKEGEDEVSCFASRSSHSPLNADVLNSLDVAIGLISAFRIMVAHLQDTMRM